MEPLKSKTSKFLPARLVQKPFPIEDSEQLFRAIITRLEEIEFSLRLKGDHWRAENVKKFKQEYFVEAKS